MSIRADLITMRTYQRPKTKFQRGHEWVQTYETFAEMLHRVIEHQRWLRGRMTDADYTVELMELFDLMHVREGALAGRVQWLGGTPLSQRRESSMFNCAFTHLKSVYDLVDAFWLLLQGCGVGGKPISGMLTGFRQPHEIVIIPSERDKDWKGPQENVETFDGTTWTIRFGDSAEAWAKGLGKVIAGKYSARRLVLDFSDVRGPGGILAGYGWVSNGWKPFADALVKICAILNNRCDALLSPHDIHDCFNLMGTVLSSRRSAEITVFDHGTPGWREFALFKQDMWAKGRGHREQSNNSLLFWEQPSFKELSEVFELLVESGGSEPGIINAEAARQRAPWFDGCNPCAEILLPDGGFCNLVEQNLAKFVNRDHAMYRAAWLLGRANYAQTCVQLNDGILQEKWQLNNDHLRLCGVGLTGIAQRPDLTVHHLRQLRRYATEGAFSMAREFGTPFPKNITTIKPSGTLSKCMDCTEGAHDPVGEFIFNNVTFSKYSPLVPVLRAAGYRVWDKPGASGGEVLITLPVDYRGAKTADKRTAQEQLDRYFTLMQHYCDQNVSITVYYAPEEVPGIVKTLHKRWRDYVGVSFLPRPTPGNLAGYAYLPQEVVDEPTYEGYVRGLKPVSLDGLEEVEVVEEVQECLTGVCPIK